MRNSRSAEWLAMGAALLLVSASWLVTGCGDEVSIVVPSSDTLLDNQPPVASLEIVPEMPFIGNRILLDASAAYDPDGDALAYQWDFDDELGTAFGPTSAAVVASEFLSYTDETTAYAPSVIVSDGGRLDEALAPVRVWTALAATKTEYIDPVDAAGAGCDVAVNGVDNSWHLVYRYTTAAGEEQIRYYNDVAATGVTIADSTYGVAGPEVGIAVHGNTIHVCWVDDEYQLVHRWAQWSGVAAAWQETTVLEEDVAGHLAMTNDIGLRAHISCQGTDGGLYYVRVNDPVGGVVSSRETVRQEANFETGLHTSICCNPTGSVVYISYIDDNPLVRQGWVARKNILWAPRWQEISALLIWPDDAETSIAYHYNGVSGFDEPNVAFFSVGRLWHYVHDGTSATRTPVSPAFTECGRSCSITVNQASGLARIAYQGRESGTEGPTQLRFAWDTGVLAGWATDEIESIGGPAGSDVGAFCEMAWDADGDGFGGRYRVCSYATSGELSLWSGDPVAGDGWGRIFSAGAGDMGRMVDIVVDKTGRRHAAYLDNGKFKMLRYSWYDPATESWQTPMVVDDGGGTNAVGFWPSIAIDDSGADPTIYIAYADVTTGNLKLAMSTGVPAGPVSWSRKIAHAGTNLGAWSVLKVDGAGRLHVVHLDYTGYANGNTAENRLLYKTGTYAGIDGVTEEVLVGPSLVSFQSCDIDSSDTPHVSYGYDGGANGRVYYRKRTGAGTWSAPVAVDDTLSTPVSRLVVERDAVADTVAVFYTRGTGTAAEFIRASRQAGAAVWDIEPLAQAALGVPMAAAVGGPAGMEFFAVPELRDDYFLGLMTRTPDGRFARAKLPVDLEGLDITDVSASGDHGRSGRAFVAAAHPGGPTCTVVRSMYARTTPASSPQPLWHASEVDASGSAHLVYYEASDASVYYMTNRPKFWTKDLVAVVPGIALPQLAVDTAGAPHIVHETPDDELVYTTKDAGVWVSQVACRVPSSMTAFDVAVGGDGRVHLAYSADGATDGLYYLSRDPSTGDWTTPQLLDSRPAGLCDVAFAGGMVHIAYSAYDGAYLRLSYTRSPGWLTATVDDTAVGDVIWLGMTVDSGVVHLTYSVYDWATDDVWIKYAAGTGGGAGWVPSVPPEDVLADWAIVFIPAIGASGANVRVYAIVLDELFLYERDGPGEWTELLLDTDMAYEFWPLVTASTDADGEDHVFFWDIGWSGSECRYVVGPLDLQQ